MTFAVPPPPPSPEQHDDKPAAPPRDLQESQALRHSLRDQVNRVVLEDYETGQRLEWIRSRIEMMFHVAGDRIHVD